MIESDKKHTKYFLLVFVLAILIVVGFGVFHIHNNRRANDKQKASLAVTENTVAELRKNISLPGKTIYAKGYNQGCLTGSVHNTLFHLTNGVSCNYAYVSLALGSGDYQQDTQRLVLLVKSKGWTPINGPQYLAFMADSSYSPYPVAFARTSNPTLYARHPRLDVLYAAQTDIASGEFRGGPDFTRLAPLASLLPTIPSSSYLIGYVITYDYYSAQCINVLCKNSPSSQFAHTYTN